MANKREAPAVGPVRLVEHLGPIVARDLRIRMVPQPKGWKCTVANPAVRGAVANFTRGDITALDGFTDDAFRIDTISYPRDTLQDTPLPETLVGLYHEGGHARFSNYRDLIVEQVQAAREGNLASSYFEMFEGLEDPRISILNGRESRGINKQIIDVNKRRLEPWLQNEGLSSMTQIMVNFHHMWLHGKSYAGYKDTEVGKATRLVESLVYEYFRTTNHDRLRQLRREIWDKIKYLETKDLNDKNGGKDQEDPQQQQSQQSPSSQQDQGQDGSSGGESSQGGKGESGQSSEGSGGDGGDGGSQREGSADDKQPSSQQQTGGRDGSGKDQSQSGDTNSTDDNSTQDDGQGQASSADSTDGSSDNQQASGAGGGESAGAGDSSQQKSRQDSESGGSQDRRQELDEKQKDAVGNMGSQLVSPQLDSKGQYIFVPNFASDDEIPPAEEDPTPIQIHAIPGIPPEPPPSTDMTEIEMTMHGFKPGEEGKYQLYQRLAASVLPIVDETSDEIRRLLPARGHRDSATTHPTGSSIERRTLATRVPAGEIDVFSRPEQIPEGQPNVVVSLLVDNSGSMQGGDKINTARTAMIFLASLCHSLDLPFMAGSFQDGASVIKYFDVDFEDPRYRIKPAILDGTMGHGRKTDLSAGLELVSRSLQSLPNPSDMRHICFVITDSGANTGLTGDDLKRMIEEQKRSGTFFIPIGLAKDEKERVIVKENLDNYFGSDNTIYPLNFNSIPYLLVEYLGRKIHEINQTYS